MFVTLVDRRVISRKRIPEKSARRLRGYLYMSWKSPVEQEGIPITPSGGDATNPEAPSLKQLNNSYHRLAHIFSSMYPQIYWMAIDTNVHFRYKTDTQAGQKTSTTFEWNQWNFTKTELKGFP